MKELKMKFRFSFSQTDDSGDDFVTIYDGPNNQSPQIVKLSGNLEIFSTISSTGNYLFVNFTSDWLIDLDSTGFIATIFYGNLYFISIFFKF